MTTWLFSSGTLFSFQLLAQFQSVVLPGVPPIHVEVVCALSDEEILTRRMTIGMMIFTVFIMLFFWLLKKDVMSIVSDDVKMGVQCPHLKSCLPIGAPHFPDGSPIGPMANVPSH